MGISGISLPETLGTISREIAADSPLFAESLAPAPGDDASGGYSDLFTVAGGAGAVHGDRYRFTLEYIFEGYLLHYGSSRLLRPGRRDFRLLAGDYMYARGLDRIAALEDIFCIEMLSRLIEFCSFVHCEGMDPRLALDAWSVVTLCLAGHAQGGVDSSWRDGFESCRRALWESDRERSSLSGLRDRMLADIDPGGYKKTGVILTNIYADLHQERRPDGD